MLLLGIDVCSGACSVALVRDGETVAAKNEPMTRGHVERLAPMVAQVMAGEGIVAPDLDGIAVTTGPGSFTGARLGVSFARGLSFAAGVPVTGLSIFEVMAADRAGITLVALPGKNGAMMLQVFDGGQALGPAAEYPADRVAEALPPGDFNLMGAASDVLLAALPGETRDRARRLDPDPVTGETVARTALSAFAENRTVLPAPLYLRAPDAKPQIGAGQVS